MSEPSSQVDASKADVTTVSAEDQINAPQQEAVQSDVIEESADQNLAQPQTEVAEPEQPMALPSATGVEEVKTETTAVEGETTIPSSTANLESNPVDPIFGDSEPVKTENDIPAEMGQPSSTLAAGILEENERQNGNGRGERGRSESTGGVSVKSGGSSASALPENVPRVGGVRCCEFSFAILASPLASH